MTQYPVDKDGIYDFGDEYVTVVADRPRANFFTDLLDLNKMQAQFNKPITDMQIPINDIKTAYDALPYLAQLGIGLLGGGALSKATLASPIGKAATNVITNVAKRTILPKISNVVMKTVNSKPYQETRTMIKGHNAQPSFTHQGRALSNFVTNEVIPSLVGAIPEASIYAKDGVDEGMKNYMVLAPSNLLGRISPLYKAPAIQYIEDEAQKYVNK